MKDKQFQKDAPTTDKRKTKTFSLLYLFSFPNHVAGKSIKFDIKVPLKKAREDRQSPIKNLTTNICVNYGRARERGDRKAINA